MYSRHAHGSWKLSIWTVLGVLALAACGSPAAAQEGTLLVDCPQEGSGGDSARRGFYLRSFPGQEVSAVELGFSARTAGSYRLRLTVRLDAYDGTVVGTSDTVVRLTDDVERFVASTFRFHDAVAPPGSTLTFALTLLSGPGPLLYAVSTSNTRCPIVQTNGTRPPLDTPRDNGRPIAIRIWGQLPSDLVAGRLEVTQACQDLDNKVRLVAGKRCFVRFHCESIRGDFASYATLSVERAGNETTLLPLNSDKVLVRPSPDRGEVDHSFLFELPTEYCQGIVTLSAELNPVLSWRGRSPFESTYANNFSATVVSFEDVPPLNLVVYQVGYVDGATIYYPPNWQREQMIDWLERAFPVEEIRVWSRTNDVGNVLPNCEHVNNDLTMIKTLNVFQALVGLSPIPPDAHYYGMVDDRGYGLPGLGFMRGCAVGVPSFVASGPTGVTPGVNTFSWDTDGSYGDWYGGHEIAHTYGREHAAFCGALGGAAYPYPNGEISPVPDGNSAIYGFDIGNRAVYGPDWHDVMTYCNEQWMSDVTYHGLMDVFQSIPTLPDGAGAGRVPGERLLIVGTIDPRSGRTDLRLPLRLPDVGDLDPREPGRYTINLRDPSGRVLARYPFTPSRSSEFGGDGEQGREVSMLFISEFVPHVDGATQVQIVGPGGVDQTVAAGPRPPVVSVLSPNGGETIDGDSISVSWTARDPDDDRMAFFVQYAADGEAWETVAVNLSGTSVNLDAINIPAGSRARFRVVATDGINLSSDVSDRDFVVVNRSPEGRIDEPAGTVTVSTGDTLALGGNAYDKDDGPLGGDSLRWTSSLDGHLGTGAALAVTGLRVGVHTITLRSTDSAGATVSDSVQVTVVSNPSELPEAPRMELVAQPRSISFEVARGQTNQRLDIVNVDRAVSISWNARSTVPWIRASVDQGVTPDFILVTFVDTGLGPGRHTGEILLTSPETPRRTVSVAVTVDVPNPGATMKRGDSNGDGRLDIADPTFWLNHLFLGAPAPGCTDAADVNDSGTADLSDSVFALTFLFLGGSAPPPPFWECGVDPTKDGLGICVYEACP